MLRPNVSQLRLHARKSSHHILLALFVLFLLGGLNATAQLTTADIVGTITDSTGAIVPNASVKLTNLATQEVRTTQTGETGAYAFTLIRPGHYSIQIDASGFKHITIQDLTVAAGDRARADGTLEIGQSSETVQVTAQTPLLQSDSSTVTSTVTDHAVQNLPLNGRNFIQLVQLVPGANEGPGNGLTSGGRPDDRRPTNGFSVNGQDDTLNNQIIDGIDNNERVIGTIGVKPSIEAIQEISVQTNNYAPEIGRTAGGVVNIISKSGTNKFHGSAYEYFRNDILDARNAFSRVGEVPKAVLRQNQYGGSLGGPIIKDRTFFFGDYEGMRLVTGGTTYTSTVPTIDQYNDIHSINGGTPEHLVSQGNGTQGFAVDPIALNYLRLYPKPNAGGPAATANNFIINPSKTQYSTTVDSRIDHRFGANDVIYGRYTYNNVSTNTPAQLPGGENGIIAGGGRWNFSGPAKNVAHQYAAAYTHTFTSNLVLQARAAYTRINNASYPLNYGTNADTKIGFGPNMNFNELTSGLTPIGITGFPDLGDGAYVPLQDIDNTFQYDGSVSYHFGNHDLKFGGGVIRRQARNIQSAFPFGQYSFGLSTDQTPTHILASTLIGAFTSSSRNYNLTPPDYRSWEPSWYAQDNWKATRNLTLVFGVRYDVFTPFTEAHNHISNFDFASALAATTADGVNSALQVAGRNGVSATAGIKTDYSNLAPRIGFAATVAPGTVIRGGYGLSFFPGNYTSNAGLKNAPFVSVYSPNCQSSAAYKIQIAKGAQPASIAPDCATLGLTSTFDAGLPLPAAQTLSSSSLSFISVDPHLRSAIVQQFNLLAERQFGANVFTIGYVGSLGQHLPQPLDDINVPRPNNEGLPRPLSKVLPNLGSVNWLASGGISNYSGLQTSLQRRYQNGLTFNMNYTYAHSLSDVVGFSEEGQQGWSHADPYNMRKYEYSNADNDIRSRVVGMVTYQLPFGHKYAGVKKLVLAGWQTNAIMAWQSGKPFTIVNSGNAGGYGNRAHPGPINGGVDRPNQLHSAKLSNPSNHRWFDTTAFAPQPLGTVGSARRNNLTGPHFRHVDLSLFKDIPLSESVRMQFRTEVFNLSNTPNFYINNNVNSSPSTLLGNASFGQVTATDPNYVPRQYQFVLKLLF